MDNKKRLAVYHTETIQVWEKAWFNANNSSFGLMQQAAFLLSRRLIHFFDQKFADMPSIRIWCGEGNNAGDGYLLGAYLQENGYAVDIYAPTKPLSIDAKKARLIAENQSVKILSEFFESSVDVHIDALFGIGLNRQLSIQAQSLIENFNGQTGLKVAVDIPSGLEPNTGIPLPIAVQADHTFTFIGLKLGLVIAQAQNYTGQLELIDIIPKVAELKPAAYLQQRIPSFPKRLSHQHKGSFGHVLVIGGHPQMGGAVMMSAEAAMHSGSGKVTILSDAKHHMAILARSPNIMTKDIQQTDFSTLSRFLRDIDTVCFGMGLGRDAWGEQNYRMVINALKNTPQLKTVIWDADALWFLANHPNDLEIQPDWIFTPHSGEAARLLDCSVAEVEQDRIYSIKRLQQKYGGQWVLKGAGSLTLEPQGLSICALGNAGMGTAGMGDVLAGMIASLKGQFGDSITLADIVALHAKAGDELALSGERGLQAHEMPAQIYKLVNYQPS